MRIKEITELVNEVSMMDERGEKKYRISVPGLPRTTYELFEAVCAAINNKPSIEAFAKKMSEEIGILAQAELNDESLAYIYVDGDVVGNFLIRRNLPQISTIDVATTVGHLKWLLNGICDSRLCMEIIRETNISRKQCGINYSLECDYLGCEVPDIVTETVDKICQELVVDNFETERWMEHFREGVTRRIIQVLSYNFDTKCTKRRLVVDERFIRSVVGEIIASSGLVKVPDTKYVISI